MSIKLFTMNIAVIGNGDIASLYASSFALAGHEVYFGIMNNGEDGIKPAPLSFENLHICGVEDASAAADIIFIATSPKDVREVAYWLGDVRGKVIIDATANFLPVCEEQINTVGAIKSITGSSNIVKVFCTYGYQQMLRPLLKNEKVHMLLVGEYRKAREATKIISGDLGVSSFIDLGSFEAMPLFDGLIKCVRELPAKYPDQYRSFVKVKR